MATTASDRAWDPRPACSAPRIAGLTIADWREPLTQEQVLERLGLRGDEFAERVFARSGVRERHLNLDPDFLARSLQGRSEQAEQELLEASIRAIDALEADMGSIGTVLSASLYSYGCPSLAHRLIEHYELPPGTDKYHVVGVGCMSAVPLVRLALPLLQADPGRGVLIVAAESMSSLLMPASPEDPRAKTVGSAIFGDGCAAALLRGDGEGSGPAILATQVHQVYGTHEAVSLRADSEDSYLHLARDLPDKAAEGLKPLVEDFLRTNHLDPAGIAHWMVHPGGRRIVECARDALELSDEDLATSWDALARHGNVGTPSIFYVLRDTIEQRKPSGGDYALAVTIGPGVTVGLMLLRF